MKTTEWLGALGALVTCAGLSLAQDPPADPNTPPPPAKDAPAVVSDASLVFETDAQPSDDRFWFSADYLLWWVKNGPSRYPLVVTGPNNVPFSGSLDIPGSRVLFGGNGLDYGASSGFRLNAGLWLNDDRTFGIEAGGFLLENQSVNFNLSGDSNGQPFFGRPFINALTGAQNVYFVSQNFSDPNLSARMTGSLAISSTTEMWGWDINGVANLRRDADLRIDALLGFRSLGLDEDLRSSPVIRNVAPGGGTNFNGLNLDPSESAAITDAFRTENRFYGPQFGGKIDWNFGRFTVDVVGKLALGVTHQELTINGSTTRINAAGAPVATAAGGVFALPTNIGNYDRDRFAVVPELGINLGYQITPRWRAKIGYTFIYWSDVARPGAVDPVVNPNLVPSDATFGQGGVANRPGVIFDSSSFWAQGINFGLEFRF